MKKCYVAFTLAAGLCLCSTTLPAQQAPKEKKFFAGTAFSFLSTKGTTHTVDANGTPVSVRDVKRTSVGIFPSIGMFIKPKLALGIEGSCYWNENEGTSNPNLGAAAFVRYVVPLWQSRFSIYNDAVMRANFSRSWGSSGDVFYISKMQTYGLYYRPGLQFRIRDNINLLASFGEVFGYSYNRDNRRFVGTPDVTETKQSTHSVGISDRFGINDLTFAINFLF